MKLITPKDHFIDVGPNLHIREWSGSSPTFILLHGLASNCHTWNGVARALSRTGRHVIAVDQRGHGLSDKPGNGYDFATITTDLARLVETLQLEEPFIIGQSWGGNVVLEFGVRYPDIARGLGFVDGGYIDFQANPENSWERVSLNRKPPHLTGMLRVNLAQRIRQAHPDWAEQGIEDTLANFEILPDGTIRPWLALDKHMQILRAMWEQRPPHLYDKVESPVLICVANKQHSSEWSATKKAAIMAAENGLVRSTTHWFQNTDHDIHVQRPKELATLFLETIHNGVWAEK